MSDTIKSAEPDPRIMQARQLMIEATRDEWQKKIADRKELIDNMICKCGHLHKEHTAMYNINYSAGFCMVDDCKCRNFLSQ